MCGIWLCLRIQEGIQHFKCIIIKICTFWMLKWHIHAHASEMHTYFTLITCPLTRKHFGSRSVLFEFLCWCYTYVVLLSRKKPFTGKSDPKPEAFIALIPEKHFLPSRSNRLVAFLKLILDLSRSMTKPTKWHVRPAKTSISLGIRPVWSESSLCALWIAKDPVLLQADREDWSDSVNGQAYQIRRWAYRSFWSFCRAAAHFILLCENIYENDIIACR